MKPIEIMKFGGGFQASIGLLGSLVDTNSGSLFVSGTPAVGQLIVLFAYMNGVVAGAPTDDQGGTYTKFGLVGSGGWYVRDSLVASAVLHTITVTGAAATGRAGIILGVSGMTKTGATAVLGSGITSFAAAGVPTTSTGVANANAPYLGAAINTNNPAGLTPPSGFIEQIDSGYNTPTFGVEVATIDGGNSGGANITWGSASVSGGNAFGLTLDIT